MNHLQTLGDFSIIAFCYIPIAMTSAPSHPQPSLTIGPTPAPTADAGAASSSAPPRTAGRRVQITATRLHQILEAARATGNATVFDALSTELKRSCRLLPDAPLRERAPDADLHARVAALRERASALARETASMRTRARPHLRDALARRLAARAARHESSFAAQLSPQGGGATDMEAVLAKFNRRVYKSAASLAAFADGIRKVRMNAGDTKRRVDNVRNVLAGLDDDARNNVNGNVSQTIHADWTIMLKDVSASRACPMSPEMYSPIPTHAPLECTDGDEDLMASPFVTPRSKARKRVARSFNGLEPRRLQLPR